MSKSLSDELLLEFTLGFAFDESIRDQLNYQQMIAVADTFIGWSLDESIDPKWSAWLAGFAEGLLAESDLLGSDWNPPELEVLTPIAIVGRLANGDKLRYEQTPRGREELGFCD